jgi:hypothetical protein
MIDLDTPDPAPQEPGETPHPHEEPNHDEPGDGDHDDEGDTEAA